MKKKIAGISLMIGFVLLIQGIKIDSVMQFQEDYGTTRIEIYLKDPMAYRALKVYEMSKDLEDCESIIKGQGEIDDGGERREVTMMAVESNYNGMEPMQVLDGNFFTEQMVKEGQNNVIISDKLSIELFNTVKSTGNFIRVNHIWYEITGVYKRYTNFYQYWQEEGMDEIYIPISSEGLRGEAGVTHLIIEGTNRQKEALEKVGITEKNAYFDDYNTYSMQLKKYVEVPLYSVAIGLGLWLVGEGTNRIKLKHVHLGYVMAYLCIGLGIYLVMRFDYGQWTQARYIANFLRGKEVTSFKEAYEFLEAMVVTMGGLQCLVCGLCLKSSKNLK
ncbi:MAG: ABC transporter permease [Cellulosilyticaceae bacterium]